jgi:hypothetical protein
MHSWEGGVFSQLPCYTRCKNSEVVVTVITHLATCHTAQPTSGPAPALPLLSLLLLMCRVAAPSLASLTAPATRQAGSGHWRVPGQPDALVMPCARTATAAAAAAGVGSSSGSSCRGSIKCSPGYMPVTPECPAGGPAGSILRSQQGLAAAAVTASHHQQQLLPLGDIYVC